jgi:hypothetical protein
MVEKVVLLKLAGEETAVDAGVAALASKMGWSEGDPGTVEEAALEYLNLLIGNIVRDKTIEDAVALAEAQALAAAEGALDLVDITCC